MCIYKINKIPLSLSCIILIGTFVNLWFYNYVALFLFFGITPILLQTQSRLINDPGDKGNDCFCDGASTFLT